MLRDVAYNTDTAHLPCVVLAALCLTLARSIKFFLSLGLTEGFFWPAPFLCPTGTLALADTNSVPATPPLFPP